jgi:hypothetical protein
LPKDDTQKASPGASDTTKVEHRANRPQTEWERMISSRKFILMMLFLVTGALGLPLLWMSPALSPLEKILWSIVNLIYTLALIAICIAICTWAYSQLMLAI